MFALAKIFAFVLLSFNGEFEPLKRTHMRAYYATMPDKLYTYEFDRPREVFFVPQRFFYLPHFSKGSFFYLTRFFLLPQRFHILPHGFRFCLRFCEKSGVPSETVRFFFTSLFQSHSRNPTRFTQCMCVVQRGIKIAIWKGFFNPLLWGCTKPVYPVYVHRAATYSILYIPNSIPGRVLEY